MILGKKVVIIDYGMGNLFSVKLACDNVGLETIISNKKEDIENAAGLILPGVGAFGNAMETLKELDLIEPIKAFIYAGKPFLGICLGMQLLMTESQEFGTHQGLDIIKGTVTKFPLGSDKVPQVGWNKVVGQKDWNGTLLEGVLDGEYMYFVHSFYCTPKAKEVSLSKTPYAGLEYCSALQQGNVFACQFHPEKSGEKGLLMYKNFANLII